LVDTATMWEIETDSVGNGQWYGPIRPGRRRFVVIPPLVTRAFFGSDVALARASRVHAHALLTHGNAIPAVVRAEVDQSPLSEGILYLWSGK
jgi:hypothetical protein